MDNPSDKFIWLAKQVFKAFPGEAAALKSYALKCGCVYYQRVFPDGNLDAQVGIYRDVEEGPCHKCMLMEG